MKPQIDFEPDSWILASMLQLRGDFEEDEAELYLSLVKPIKDGVIVEVGINYGRSFASILPTALENGNQVFAVDNWINKFKNSPKDRFKIFRRNMQRLGFWGKFSVLRMDSLIAAGCFEDASIDLVFLDASKEYERYRAEIDYWLHKIKPGGFVTGHDYGRNKWVGVQQAVDERFGRPDKLSGTFWAVRKQTQPPIAP